MAPRPSRSKFSRLSCSAWSASSERGSPRRRSGGMGQLRHPAGVDAQAAVALAARQRDHPLEERRPHVELDLLGHPKPVVQEVRQTVAAARPGLDPEPQPPVLAVGAEDDLARLEVARQRGEAEAGGSALHHPHGAVPDALDLLVADAVRERRRRVLGPRALLLAAIQRRGAPQVAPRRDAHADRPAGGGGEAAEEGLAAWHSLGVRGYPPAMLTKALNHIGLRGWHLHMSSLGSIYLCIAPWIRAKTVDQEERGNAERRALFVGLW